jgi:hypothetical protein
MGEACPTCHGHGKLPPLRECANDNCAVIFRFQDGRAKTYIRHSNARYCSHLCAKAQSERDRRRRRREATP